MTVVTMERITVDGKTVQYVSHGTGDPVVFIHGAFIADALLTFLREPTLSAYQLIVYHRRGYGGSSPSDASLTICEQAEHCLALMRRLGVERAHIVGHSFGGAVALQLALQAPETVRSLSVLEPALAVGSSGDAYHQSLRVMNERYMAAGAGVVVDEFLEARWPGYKSQLDEVLPGSTDEAVNNAAAFFEVDLPGLLEWQFGEEDARRIKHPLLSLLGARSETLSPRFGEVHRMLLASVPGATGYVVPDAGHFMSLENPHDTSARLASFFASIPEP